MSRLLLGAVLLMSCASLAEERTSFVGTASVIDGDTIEIHGQRIRLFGVDAPEGRQTCVDAARRAWGCGKRAAMELADLIGRATVHCKQRDRDRNRCVVPVCRTGNQDFGGWMTGNGWAVASRRYSIEYVRDEEAARRRNLGICQRRSNSRPAWRCKSRPLRRGVLACTQAPDRGPGCKAAPAKRVRVR